MANFLAWGFGPVPEGGRAEGQDWLFCRPGPPQKFPLTARRVGQNPRVQTFRAEQDAAQFSRAP